MSASIKMISTLVPEKSVFITHEAGWKNTKVYVNGKLIKEFSSASEIKTGAYISLEDFGEIEIKLNPVTFVFSLNVDGKPFEEEKTAIQLSESMNGPIIIFAILAIINFFVFAFAIIGFNSSQSYQDDFDLIMLVIIGGYTLIYSSTLVFLIRKVYFFYFIGTALYSLTTFYYCYEVVDELNGITLIALAIRLLLMFVLLYHFRRAVAFMRENKDHKRDNVLDSNF